MSASDSVAAIAARLTEAQKRALAEVCQSNGGGVSVRCRTGDDGYGIPTASVFRNLHELGLIQGKAGAYSIVVHTREGLAVYRAHLASASHSEQPRG